MTCSICVLVGNHASVGTGIAWRLCLLQYVKRAFLVVHGVFAFARCIEVAGIVVVWIIGTVWLHKHMLINLDACYSQTCETARNASAAVNV